MSMDFAKRIPPLAHYIITHTFGIRGTRAVKSRTRYPRMTWVWHGCRRTIRFFSFPLIEPFTCAFFSRIVSQEDVFVLAALGNLRARSAAEGSRRFLCFFFVIFFMLKVRWDMFDVVKYVIVWVFECLKSLSRELELETISGEIVLQLDMWSSHPSMWWPMSFYFGEN